MNVFLGRWNGTDILQTTQRLIGSQGVFTAFMIQAVMPKVGPLGVAILMPVGVLSTWLPSIFANPLY